MSYIKMDAKTVKKRCEESLESIYEARREKLEKAIKREMTRSFWNWFPAKTRKAAIDSLKSCSCTTIISEYEMIMTIRYSDQQDRLERLIEAAENTKDGMIYVTVDDIRQFSFS